MGQWSNGLRSQQEQPECSKVNNPPSGPRAEAATDDGTSLNDPIEAVREVASKTVRRWPDCPPSEIGSDRSKR